IRRPIHIISANLHSVKNIVYAHQAFDLEVYESIEQIALDISTRKKKNRAKEIDEYASGHGFIDLPDESGTNIGAQIIDTAKMVKKTIIPGLKLPVEDRKKPVIVLMDYAFGEQAYECFDELLKPFEKQGETIPLDVL